jgi:hypothetical protein
MKNLTKILALSVAMGAAGWAAPASAQATRTWVSGVGDDVNPCSRTAPCKTFAGAISKTAAGGEINCLDPAGFGAVTITKSITIDCTGTLGGVLASSTTGVIVNGAGARVVLRGLTINGGPPNLPGVNGVRYLQGESLLMEQVHIMNFTAAAPNGFGIIVNATSLAKLYVIDSTITNNGTAVSGGGILIAPSGASAGSRVQLTNVRVEGNTFQGLRVDTGANPSALDNFVALDNVTLSGSATGLVVTTPVGGSDASVVVSRSTISNNTTGINGSGNFSRTAVSDSTLFNNGTAITASGGALVQSFHDNRLVSNPAGTTFSPPDLTPQ